MVFCFFTNWSLYSLFYSLKYRIIKIATKPSELCMNNITIPKGHREGLPLPTHIQEAFLQRQLDVGFDAGPLLPFASVAFDQRGQRSWVAH